MKRFCRGHREGSITKGWLHRSKFTFQFYSFHFGDWATVHKTRSAYRHSRVPLPEMYSSISGAFHPVYSGETEISGIEVKPALDGAKVGWIAVVFERNNCCVAIPDTWFGDNIYGLMQRSES